MFATASRSRPTDVAHPGALVAGERNGRVGHAATHGSPSSAPTGAGRSGRELIKAHQGCGPTDINVIMSAPGPYIQNRRDAPGALFSTCDSQTSSPFGPANEEYLCEFRPGCRGPTSRSRRTVSYTLRYFPGSLFLIRAATRPDSGVAPMVNGGALTRLPRRRPHQGWHSGRGGRRCRSR